MPDQQPAAATRTLRFPDPMPDERIRDLARDMLAGQVVDITMVPADLVYVVFMPLIARPFAGWTRDELEQIMVFGINSIRATAPRSVNGLPIFREMNVWRFDDYACAVALARAAQQAQEAVLGPPLARPGEPPADPQAAGSAGA